MHIDEPLKRVKKIEKKQALSNEVLRLIIDNGKFERIVEIKLGKPTHNY